MPRSTAKLIALNGIELNVDDVGDGAPVVMIMGTGSPGRVWHAHQQPVLRRNGFRVVTFDNRGIAPSSECAAGIGIDDMVADTIAVVEHLDAGPVALVGTSLGSRVASEVTLARPDLVRCQALLGTYGRMGLLQQAMSAGERAVYDRDIELPPDYRTAVAAHLNLSPHTLDDDTAVQDWLDVIEFSGQQTTPGIRAQMQVHMGEANRLDALRGTRRPTLVLSFADDRTVPAHLGREVADAIPDAQYAVIEDAGHWGYLEQPDAVNTALVDFLTAHY